MVTCVFAMATIVGCAGDVAEDDSTKEGDLARSATSQPPPPSNNRPPARAPARSPNTDPIVGNPGIGAAGDDSSDQEIKRPPE